MTVSHRLTGYDRITEQLALAYDIPASHDALSRRLAEVDTADEDAVGIYVFGDEVAKRLASALGIDINVDRYEWCLEPAPKVLAAVS